jgi:dynactin complex subunit
VPEAGAGFWAGVALDEPRGRNDGSTRSGLRYFTCEPGHGTFIRPAKVTMLSGAEAERTAGGVGAAAAQVVGALGPGDEI